MSTMNIYVPDAMKAEMDALEPAPNWSSLCQAAIKQELDANKARQGDRQALVERVKAAGSQRYKDGYADGEEFAAMHANLDDFELFAERYAVVREKLKEEEQTPLDCIRALTEELDLDQDYYTGDKALTWRYLDGFAQAMIDTWKEIISRVEQAA